MRSEVNIIEIVKWLRFSRVAFSRILNKKELLEIQESCRYVIIDTTKIKEEKMKKKKKDVPKLTNNESRRWTVGIGH